MSIESIATKFKRLWGAINAGFLAPVDYYVPYRAKTRETSDLQRMRGDVARVGDDMRKALQSVGAHDSANPRR